MRIFFCMITRYRTASSSDRIPLRFSFSIFNCHLERSESLRGGRSANGKLKMKDDK